MKRYAIALAFVAGLTLPLSGCGGGGGGGGGGPATKATAKVSVFGAISSSCRIASIGTTLTVPSGILVNYSSPAPAGYPPHTYPVRGSALVPSGPVQVDRSEITGTFNTSTNLLTVSLVNGSRLLLRGSTIGDGTEVAQVIFGLATPGVLPTLPDPWQDPLVTVYQEVPTVPIASVLPLSGQTLKLTTTYQ